MKQLLYLVFLLTISLFVFLGWQVWQNNRDVSPPTQVEIKQHFDKSIDWLNSNYSKIENIQNPILWALCNVINAVMTKKLMRP